MKQIRKILQGFIDEGLYPEVHIAESSCDREVIIDGKKVLMFGSYNYLSHANHPEVKKALIEGVEKYGVGAGGVRLLSGTYDIHVELEKKIAQLTKQEDAMTIASGFGTNSGIIPGVMNLFGLVKINPFSRKSIIISDELNHASIVDGARLSYSKVVPYKHLDTVDLENKLKKYKNRRKLVVTDGVFSMDGDIAPLARIVELAKNYDALTMVDDAHSFGVLGKNGSGTAEHCGVAGQIDLNMGTFSKGLGVVGGFVSGNRDMIKYLRVACRSYVFSDSIPPAVATAIKRSVELLEEEPARRDNILKKADWLRLKFKNVGFNTFGSTTQIVPVWFGPDEKSIQASELLLEHNIYAPAVRWPAVPKNESRIRLATMANHTTDDLNKLVEVMEKIGKELKVI